MIKHVVLKTWTAVMLFIAVICLAAPGANAANEVVTKVRKQAVCLVFAQASDRIDQASRHAFLMSMAANNNETLMAHSLGWAEGYIAAITGVAGESWVKSIVNKHYDKLCLEKT